MKGWNLSIRNILLLTVGTLTFLIALIAMRELYLQWRQLQEIRPIHESLGVDERLFDVIEQLSIERDITYFMLNATDRDLLNQLHANLLRSRQRVNKAFDSTLQALRRYPFPDGEKFTASTGQQFTNLVNLRKQVDDVLAEPPSNYLEELGERWFTASTALIVEVEDQWMQFTGHFVAIDPIVTQRLMFQHFLGMIMEHAGRERALVGRLIIRNAAASPRDMTLLLRWQGTVEQGWIMAEKLAIRSQLNPKILPYFTDARSHYLTVYDMVQELFYTPDAQIPSPYPISSAMWLELATQATDSLFALKDSALKETRHYVEIRESEAWRSISMHVLLLLAALALCVYAFRVIMRRVIAPVNAMVEALLNATEGKPVAPLPNAQERHDEIGKLGHVLGVFQKNSQEIAHSAAMLERYTRALERSNKELDDFAYIASHDLKEPLRGIHNHASFLLEDNEQKLDEESANRLHRLVFLSQRMERLVNDLLYFSRLGRQEMAIQPVDFNALVRDVGGILQNFLEENHARLVVPRELPVVVCDKPRVMEVLQNLVTNAVKYNDKPEKIVEIGFQPLCTAPDGTAYWDVFYVKDNGIGIAQEFYEDIFRIFKRLHGETHKKAEGTGVGLTFVKKIVERHGGKIWLESELGKGSVFYFTLKGKAYEQAIAA